MHVGLRRDAHGGGGGGAQELLKVGMLHRQPAQAVVARAEIEPLGARVPGVGSGEVLLFQLVGGLVGEGVGVLREAAGKGLEQFAVLRRLDEQRLHELEAERRGGADEVGVIIRGEAAAAVGERVAELVDGEPLDGTAGVASDEAKQERQHNAAKEALRQAREWPVTRKAFHSQAAKRARFYTRTGSEAKEFQLRLGPDAKVEMG